jgi:serine protease Do
MSHRYRLARHIIRTVLISIVSSLVVIAIVGLAVWHYRAPIAKALFATIPVMKSVPLTTVNYPVIAPVKSTPAAAITPTVASVVAAVNKSVVSIEVAQDAPELVVGADGTVQQDTTLQTIGGGSGFFVSRDGLLLTNKHVVDFTDAAYTVVTSTGKQYTATLVAKDPTLDLALLKVDGTFTPLTLGDSSTLVLGQQVVAIGFVLGQFNNSVSSGIVSGLSRSITAGDSATNSTEQLSQLIQTDAPINLGNSGGPLLTMSGTVIGVNVATATGSQDIGFALPINSVKSFVSEYL